MQRAVAALLLSHDATHATVTANVDPAAVRAGNLPDHELDDLRDALKAFVRVYAFLGQVMKFSDGELQALYLYGKLLLSKLKSPAAESGAIDLGTSRGWSVSTPQVPAWAFETAHGHDRSPWKMFPPGIASAASRSTGEVACRHGAPLASRARQSASGSARTPFRPWTASRAANARTFLVIGVEQHRRGVQGEQRQRMKTPHPVPRGQRSSGRSGSGSRP